MPAVHHDAGQPVTWTWLDTVQLVLVLGGGWLLGTALERGVIGRAVHELRLRASKRAPVGSYRLESGYSIRFGSPDDIMVFKLPLELPGEARPARRVAVTDAGTTFHVGERQVSSERFLEAYDEELGPIVFEVRQAGKLGAVRIEPRPR